MTDRDDDDGIGNGIRSIANWGDPGQPPDHAMLAARPAPSGGVESAGQRRAVFAVAAAVLVVAVVAALFALRDDGATDVAAGDGTPAVDRIPVDVADLPAASCTDVTRFTQRMANVGVTYDYDPSTSVEQLADGADLVVRGELVGIREETIDGSPDPYIVFLVRVEERTDDEMVAGSELEFSVSFNPAAIPFSEFAAAFTPRISTVLFLESGPWPGGWATGLESFWVACAVDDIAVPARVRPQWAQLETLEGFYRLATNEAPSLSLTPFVGEAEDAGFPRVEENAEGAIVTLQECFFEPEGKWTFSGSVDLPQDTPSATLVMAFGWATRSDTGPWPDIVRIIEIVEEGEFVVTFAATDTTMSKQASATPSGTLFDSICVAVVSHGTVDVVDRRPRVGPTSDTVAGPRPTIEGRLTPSVNDPEPRTPTLTGWLTGLELGDGFVKENPTFVGGLAPGQIGPGTISIDGTSFELPEATPYGAGGCGMLNVLSRPEEFNGDGAGATTCYILAGLTPTGEVEWLSAIDGRFVDWDGDPTWSHAFEPDETVEEFFTGIEGADVLFRRTGIPHRLPLRAGAPVDCDGRTASELEVIPEAVAEAKAVIDVASGEVIAIACQNW